MDSTSTLTRDTRDRAAAALRRAHATGRPHNRAWPWGDGGAVCACVIIAEELGLPEAAPTAGAATATAALSLYAALGRIGMIGSRVVHVFGANDSGWDGLPASFAAAAEVVATFLVVDEAEAICRDAALVPA